MKVLLLIYLSSLMASLSTTEGEIRTQTDVLEGEISFKLEENSVILKLRDLEGNMQYNRYTADQLLYIKVKEGDQCVKYKSVLLAENQRKLFMKVLTEGKRLSLVQRENVKYSVYDEVTLPKFFILDSNDSLYPIYTKKTLLEVLSDQENAIKFFIKSKNIQFDVESDLIALIDYYNEL